MKHSLLSLAIIGSLSPAVAIAADENQQHDDHREVETITITTSPLRLTKLESAQPVSILAGEALKQNQSATLGETLKNMVGVHSTYYGPIASSPIIRGLEGPRVKVVQNGMDASDASRVGPDHVVTTEASNAERIEVLRGPATLLYGSGAIGGVVNVIDNRLPSEKKQGVDGNLSYRHDSVSSEDLFNADLNGGSGNFAWHLDAFDRKTDNYEIPEGILIDGEPSDGELESSSIDAEGFTVGAGWIGDDVNVALSYGKLENQYGIPGHHHHHEDEHDDDHEDEHEGEHEDEHGEEEEVFGVLEQDRYQAMVDWNNLGGVFSKVHWHSAYTDYQHREVEENMIGTTFDNETIETRLWAELKPMNGWNGVVGLHYSESDFEAIGEEAFTAPSKDSNLALFVLEEKLFGDLRWQFGARIERVELEPDNSFFEEEEHHDDEHDDDHDDDHDDEHEEIDFGTLSFTPISASAGFVYQYTESSSFAANLSYSERAPSAAEIFSNGPHIGTNTFEVGAGFELVPEGDGFEIVQSDRKVSEETSFNIDLGWRYNSDDISANIGVFYNWVDDYLYQQDTGFVFDEEHGHAHDDDHDDDHDEDHDDDHGDEHGDEDDHGHEGEEEGLPIFIFTQQDAKLYGFEAELNWHMSEQWHLGLLADYTRAKLDEGGNVPRIPPMRIAADLHWEQGNWHAQGSVTHYFEQDKTAELETSTDSYTLVNASVSYFTEFDNSDLTVYLKGNNLTDEEARVHSSFLKEDAPLPGRSVIFGLDYSF